MIRTAAPRSARRARIRRLAAVALLLAATTACTTPSAPTEPAATTVPPTSTPSPTPTAYDGPLFDLILSSPANSQLWADGVDVGELSINEIAKYYNDPIARAAELRQLGVLRAAANAWVLPDDRSVVIEVLQFRSQRNARNYVVEARMYDDGPQGPFGSIEDSQWFIDGDAMTFCAAKGTLVFALTAFGFEQDEATQLAVEQYERLP